MELPESRSYWLASAEASTLPADTGLDEVDVVVVGGGIAGITTAYLLKSSGLTVGLLEARWLLSGVTGHTTAKVSAQHGLIYADLCERFGDDVATQYGASQLAALAWLRGEAAALGVDCELEERDSFVFAEEAEFADRLRAEADAAARCGLPASFVPDVDLPFPTAGAVRFTGQAQFHPVRWLQALANAIPGDGSYIAQGVRVSNVDADGPCVVHTNAGDVAAGHVVVATHSPILDRGFYFARMAPVRDLVVAAEAPSGLNLAGMYLSAQTGHSIRLTPNGGKPLVIVGGEHHRPGAESDALGRHERLAQWAAGRLGLSQIDYRWSAQDNTTVDRLPYIGRYGSSRRPLWVAAGFGQWGMTNGILSGLILRDLITGADNQWSALYDPKRANLRQSAKAYIRDNLTVAAHLVGDRLSALRPVDTSALRPGEAIVGRLDHHIAAVRRDLAGTLCALSAACTHLGCAVAFNDDEQTWDCPCHGSRFALDGSVLDGPASEPLPMLKLPDDAT